MALTNSDRTVEISTEQDIYPHDYSPVLINANRHARAHGIGFAGSISPEDAWSLVASGKAQLVDVRTVEERESVGFVPSALHIAWQIGPAMVKNPRFIRELERRVSKSSVILLLCRSGKRSAAAAAAATAAGFTQVYNVLEGFEGEIDEKHPTGRIGGWRQRGLPWV